jgi:putative glutamine amidotransferase
MRPRIAIPEPHSAKPEYNARSLPQYENAVREAGGEPVVVPLDRTPDEIAQLISTCDAVLLPGSPADVDPQKYDAPRDPHTAPADAARDRADELLLQDAYNMRKPIFGICYGLQALNVWRTGTLRQHIASELNHEAGRAVPRAHNIRVEPSSRLAEIVIKAERPPRADDAGRPEAGSPKAQVSGELAVNSSHHQAADVVGDGLRAVARAPEDGVIEALEGTAPDHFVLAVQWHPERSVEDDAPSRELFRALVEAARAWHGKKSSEYRVAGT